MEMLRYDLNKEVIKQIETLFCESDFLTLIKFSKSMRVKPLIELYDSECFYLEGYQNLRENIQIFARIGIAYYNLGKYKEAINFFKKCNKIFKNIDTVVEIAHLSIKYNIDTIIKNPKVIYDSFLQLRKNNDSIVALIHGYIAHSQIKLHNPVFAFCEYQKVLKFDILKDSTQEKLYLDILLGRCDALYELTKIFITTIKILVFIIVVNIMIIPFIPVFCTIYLNLNKILNNFALNAILFFLVLTLPKVMYKLFYFLLRKLRRFIAVNFIRLFPQPFEKTLKSLLNIINLKFIPYNIHRQTIQKIEKMDTIRGFNTFFAIARLYYYLGEYTVATFYIQKALSYNLKKNYSELAMSYHYLARISYKTSNNSTAINFYDKAIEFLMNVDKSEENYRIESLPSVSDMIKYTQENRNKIEQTTFSRTYLPLIITLIITMLVCVAQIYYSLPNNENQAIGVFGRIYELYTRLITP